MRNLILVTCFLLFLSFATWFDIQSLAGFDVCILLVMALCVLWAIVSKHCWLKFLVGAFLFLGMLMITQSFEPVLRSLSGGIHPGQNAYNDGLKAYHNAIRAYRPFTVLAASGLFLLLLSTKSNTDKKAER